MIDRLRDWVSVEEELPMTGSGMNGCSSLTVLAWTNYCVDPEDAVFASYYDSGTWFGYQLLDDERVTHWRYLPEGPV